MLGQTFPRWGLHFLCFLPWETKQDGRPVDAGSRGLDRVTLEQGAALASQQDPSWRPSLPKPGVGRAGAADGAAGTAWPEFEAS